MNVEACRARFKSKFPAEFRDGTRCGLLGKFEGARDPGGYPIGFHTWPTSRKNAWWSGYNIGYAKRRAADGK